ncbi:MAG: hypothetical protein LBM13_04695 [Candidatus Ancillula sp.]|nr:hypothetical protein [Candidatus Ancillula sp.]
MGTSEADDSGADKNPHQNRSKERIKMGYCHYAEEYRQSVKERYFSSGLKLICDDVFGRENYVSIEKQVSENKIP